MNNQPIDSVAFFVPEGRAELSKSEIVSDNIMIKLRLLWRQKEIIKRSDAYECSDDNRILGHRKI